MECLNPFVFREVLSPEEIAQSQPDIVLIPSCSGKFYHAEESLGLDDRQSLNPFVFREVLSQRRGRRGGGIACLNPFVFREVLSHKLVAIRCSYFVLIPSCSGKFYHTRPPM